MGIPNKTTATYPHQSKLDSGDIDIIIAGNNQSGVYSGCNVTSNSNMTVTVASGTIAISGVEADVTETKLNLSAANPTNPRFDLIVVRSTGTPGAITGTAAVNPVFPPIPGNAVVLAVVYVPAQITSLKSEMIIDKRVLLKDRPYVRVEDYGAKPDIDSTAAFNLAITAAGTSKSVTFSATYAVNLSITTPVHLVGGAMLRKEVPNQSRLVPWDISKPVISIGRTDSTRLRGVTLDNVSITCTGPNGTGTKGVKIDGIDEAWYNNLAVLGFTDYCLYLTSSLNQTSYQFFNGLALQAEGTAFKANYGSNVTSSFTTSIYLNNFGIWESADVTGYALDLDGVELALSNGYMDLYSKHGIIFRQSPSYPQPRILGSNVVVDSKLNSDILVETTFDSQAYTEVLRGTISVDGLYQKRDKTTLNLSGRLAHLGYTTALEGADVIGTLYFQPTNGTTRDENAKITSGTTGQDLTLYSRRNIVQAHATGGNVQVWHPSAVDFRVVDTETRFSVNSTGPKLPTYTVATLPVATEDNAGCVVFVSDGKAGTQVRCSTGSNWINLG